MELIDPIIIWNNDHTNETQAWFMDGDRVDRRGTVLGEDGEPTFVGLPFSIVGVGDLDGDGTGDSSSTLGHAGGPIGALIATGIVSALGLGDDSINQATTILFAGPTNVGTPDTVDQSQGNSYNCKMSVGRGGAQIGERLTDPGGA